MKIMIKKFLTALIFIILSCSVVNAVVGHGSYVDTIIPGKWNIYGQGFCEKEFVRLELGLQGDMNLQTQKVEEISDDVKTLLLGSEEISRFLVDEKLKALTSYDINLKLDITGAGIKIWNENIPNGIRIPVLLPNFEPTANNPYVLPTITRNKLSYTLRFDSNSSGVLRIAGYVDVDVVGECEVKADCTIWRDGTPMPLQDSSTKSGCNLGINLVALALIFFGGIKFVWN